MIRTTLADLPGLIEETLVSLNNGLYAARQKGIIAEMPEKVAFDLEIIGTLNGITRTVTDDKGAQTITDTRTSPTKETTTVKQPQKVRRTTYPTQTTSSSVSTGSDEIEEYRKYEEATGSSVGGGF